MFKGREKVSHGEGNVEDTESKGNKKWTRIWKDTMLGVKAEGSASKGRLDVLSLTLDARKQKCSCSFR